MEFEKDINSDQRTEFGKIVNFRRLQSGIEFENGVISHQ